MKNSGVMDQIDSLINPNRHPTSSQEEKLQSYQYARDSEVFPGGMQSSSSAGTASEQATGIIMESLPESSDDYQTPPEYQLSSQNSGNDGQVPIETAVVGQETEVMTADDSCKPIVDLKNNSDNLNFSENSPIVVEDNNTLLVDEENTEQIEAEYAVGETNAGNCVAEALKKNASKVFDEMSMRKDTSPSEVNLSLNKPDDHLNRKGKRQLPFSMDAREKKKRGVEECSKHDVLMDMLNRVQKILVAQGQRGATGGGGDDDGDCDFLETAKRRGLTFPRPRWWPPSPEGGFED